MINELNFLRSLSPLHVGSGSTIGVVDLPIQREPHTQFPKIGSSSLKGALRSQAYHNKGDNKDEYIKIFGNEPGEKDYDQSGAISISESKILFFPIQSLKNVFTYVTCPMVLDRFAQESKQFGIELNFDIPKFSVSDEKALVSDKALIANEKLVLQEFVYEAVENDELKEFATKLGEVLELDDYFSSRVVVVTNDEFSQFAQQATEISPRIRVDVETGTVAKGALFYEENMPPEAIFYCFFTYQDSKPDSNNHFSISLPATETRNYFNQFVGNVFQVGGNSSIGRGLIQRTEAGVNEK